MTKQSVRVLINQNDKNLPSQPKILSAKSSHPIKVNQQISNFLNKASPLKNIKVNKQKQIQIHKNNISANKQAKHSLESEKYQQSSSFWLKNKQTRRQGSIKENENKQIRISQRNHSSSSSSNQQTQMSKSFSSYNFSKTSQQINPLIRKTDNIKNQNQYKSGSKLIKRQRTSRAQSVKQSPSKKQSINVNNTNPNIMVENRFYEYCIEQITKLANQNKQIRKSIKVREEKYKKLKQKNLKREVKIENYKIRFQQAKKQRQQSQNQRRLLVEQLQRFQKYVQYQLPQKYKETYKKEYYLNKQQIGNKMGQIKSQQMQIAKLKQKIMKFNEQKQLEIMLDQQNKSLQEQIQKVKTKRINIENKIFKKNYIIKHLYQIKQAEFQNLIQSITKDSNQQPIIL